MLQSLLEERNKVNFKSYEKTKVRNDTEVTEMENCRIQKTARVERMNGRAFPKQDVWHKPYGKAWNSQKYFLTNVKR
jgi:predicted nucleic acid-binding OB-fold protein